MQHGVIVYALFRDAPAPSPDLVAAVGAFPLGYRPTENPGEVLTDKESTMHFWTCDVRRDQLVHYERIRAAQAFTLYPRLRDFVVAAQRTLQATGDLPSAVGPR
jgi:hypothetical protein